MFKRQLKAFLQQRKVTIAELARKTGIPKQTISDWLSGTRPRNMDDVRRVADALDIGIAQLFFGIPAKEMSSRQDPESADGPAGVAAIQRYFDFFFENSVALERILDLRTGFPSALSLAWEKILGWPRSELMKKSWLDLIHPDDRDQVASVAKATASAGISPSTCEHRLLTASGAYIRVHTKIAVDLEEQIMASISRLIEK